MLSLEELCTLPGVSGNELKVRRALKAETEKMGLKATADVLGNLIVSKEAQKEEKFKVMLSAHMDEVGLIVTQIEENGLLRFEPIGMLDHRVLPGKEVLVGPEEVRGVIGLKAIHLQKREERKRTAEISELYIDIGAKDEKEAKDKIEIGYYASFATSPALNDYGLVAKAIDDRAGCYLLLRILQNYNPLNFSLAIAFTAQEELGGRGAAAAAYKIEPDLALTVECTPAHDLPEVEEHNISTCCGRGPALTVMDGSVVVSPQLISFLEETAQKRNIPYQYRRFTGSFTDAGPISLAKGGRKAGVVSIPCRYIHSPNSFVLNKDLQNTYNLVLAFLEELEEKGEELIGRAD